MKKLLLVLSTLALASAGYAGGCGGGCGDKKPSDAPAPAQPADKAPETPKS